jgi:long-chain-fatty-acid--CoA ligase ACSBG
MVDLIAPMVVGGTVHFAQPDALKGSLVNTLKEVRKTASLLLALQVRPTCFLGVPRVWEKIQEKMIATGKENSGFKARLCCCCLPHGAESHCILGKECGS